MGIISVVTNKITENKPAKQGTSDNINGIYYSFNFMLAAYIVQATPLIQLYSTRQKVILGDLITPKCFCVFVTTDQSFESP